MIELGIARVFGAMLRDESADQPLQPIRLERADFVGAAHLVPELEQKRGDAAHPAAGDADQDGSRCRSLVRIFCRSRFRSAAS